MDSYDYYQRQKERNRIWFAAFFFFCVVSGLTGFIIGNHLSDDEHNALVKEIREDRRNIITSAVYGDIITAKLHHEEKYKTALEFVEFNMISNIEAFTQHGSKLDRLNEEEAKALNAVYRYWQNVCYKHCLDRIEYILEKVEQQKKAERLAAVEQESEESL